MKYFAFIILTLLSLNLSAQQKQFSLDERGKYIYYEVVDAKSLSKDSLMARANVFINKLNKKSIKQESLTDSSIVANGKYIIDKTVLVAEHPSAEINYKLTFEAKDGRYRFWFNDFEYIPYQRDRYGNYVATTQIGIPLDKSPSKLNVAEWKETVTTTYEKVQKLSDQFKKFLSTTPLITPIKNERSVVPKKW